MVRIDIDMPHDCASCWIRLNMGCKIANASGWLNSRRDENCPLRESLCNKCEYYERRFTVGCRKGERDDES